MKQSLREMKRADLCVTAQGDNLCMVINKIYILLDFIRAVIHHACSSLTQRTPLLPHGLMNQSIDKYLRAIKAYLKNASLK